VKHKAQMQIVNMLKEQRALQETIQCSGPDHAIIQDNRSLLKSRLVDAERNLELLDSRLRDARENYEREKQEADARASRRPSQVGE
jgi:hypothetical protein